MVKSGDDAYTVHVEHPPTPDLNELQQQEPVYDGNPCVPVRVEGPVRTQNLPNRQGPASADLYPQFAQQVQAVRILNANLARARASLFSDTKWFYIVGGPSGVKVPVPANVVLVVNHCDEAWALGNGQASTISCIEEYFGQN